MFALNVPFIYYNVVMLVCALPRNINLHKNNSVEADKTNHFLGQNQGLLSTLVTTFKKEGKIIEEFGKRNVISITVVRRDIHRITENSKVHRAGRMPYCLVPKITHYYKVKRLGFQSMENSRLCLPRSLSLDFKNRQQRYRICPQIEISAFPS